MRKFKLVRIQHRLTFKAPGNIGYGSRPVDHRYPEAIDIVVEKNLTWKAVGTTIFGKNIDEDVGSIREIGGIEYRLVAFDEEQEP